MLILYFPLDDPIVREPFRLLDLYKRHGASVIEIALPTVNPVLDGQVIRDSMTRVLSHKTLDAFFEDIREIAVRYPEIKIQLMAYCHLIKEYSLEKFAEKVRQCGISYVLPPDAGEKELREMDEIFRPSGISVIRIAPYRLKREEIECFRNSQGYIFQRTTDGKTGGTHEISERLRENTELLRKNGIRTPVVYAFGISEKEQVDQAMKMGADGVVIGSALFPHILSGTVDEYLSNFDMWF